MQQPENPADRERLVMAAGLLVQWMLEEINNEKSIPVTVSNGKRVQLSLDEIKRGIGDGR